LFLAKLRLKSRFNAAARSHNLESVADEFLLQ